MGYSLRVFSWNVGGAGSRAFYRALKLAIQNHRPDFVILLEPQMSGESANGVCDKLGFPNSCRVEATGRAGGVWVFWDGGIFSVQAVAACSQHLTLQISRGNDPPWMLSAVYTSPRQREQRVLWQGLISESKYIEIPWLLTGDFNAISRPEEKSGLPARNTLRRCQIFTERINSAELVDLGFSGPKFTWSRGDHDQTFKASRLDRSLCNLRWNATFPNSTVIHLPRYQSDHNPILTNVILQPSQPYPAKQFRFEAAWMTNNTLPNLISSAWDGNVALPMALESLAGKLVHWNEEVFGDVKQRKRRLLARLKGIELRLAGAFSPGLAKLHSKLSRELDKVLEQEELIWFQRSRDNWVKYGERNTAYFHQLVNIRRRFNKIEALLDDNDDWVTDSHSLALLVFNFFTNIYLQENSPYEDRMPKGVFPRMSHTEATSLFRPFGIQDIHKAIFDMKPFQAPGPDGFQAVFYQQF
ncbi:unnamed protein product [Linum trigynum]|uniref:Endonuclease/exonuclease/phosphatase domain-containing protein n=1 Tax=Linum trigynum TaxID=586398 RepID=A0AAV2G5C0_9ROSI